MIVPGQDLQVCAFRARCKEENGGRSGESARPFVRGIHIPPRRYAALDPEVRAALERLHKDDEEARQARDAAEAQFDEADRRMSTSMACTGAQMAIDAWEMREKVIRKAEALARRK